MSACDNVNCQPRISEELITPSSHIAPHYAGPNRRDILYQHLYDDACSYAVNINIEENLLISRAVAKVL